MTTGDAAFAGSIPALYDRYLGPLLFTPYAHDLARRLSGLTSGRVLETAAGTGRVTRVFAQALPPSTELIATDLNQAMLDFARSQPGLERITMRAADATRLPFDDASFDAIVCQFGVMFFPDRVAGYREARRVLRSGGRFLFNVWDSLAHNPVGAAIHDSMAALFPTDPPRFLERAPYGYHDVDAIRDELGRAGFTRIAHETVSLPCRAPSSRDPAVGFCQGSPLRGEIEARDAAGLGRVTDAAAAAIARRFGSGAVEATMRAHVFTASA